MDNNSFNLTVNVRIEKMAIGGGYTGEGLSIQETLSIRSGDFLEMCRILGEFNTLAERIKKEQSSTSGK